MIAVIIVASVLSYLGLALSTARFAFRKIRPYTEPLSCNTPYTCGDGHEYDSCYRRWGLVDTRGEAAVFALLWGVLWPLTGLVAVLMAVVQTGARELPEERDAKIARAERELGMRP